MLAIYVKDLTRPNSRFRPMDMKAVQPVNNRIYATLYDDEQRQGLEQVVNNLNKDNPNYKFELRKLS